MRSHDPFARSLLTILPVIKAKGFKTAIISGGLDIFTQRLKERYQLDYAFSNTVEIRDNVLTDNITLPIMNAANKKQTLVDLAARLNIATENIIACGDGANDLPMLEHAGTGIARKAKPVVRKKSTIRLIITVSNCFFFLLKMNYNATHLAGREF